MRPDDFGPTSHSFVSQKLRLSYLDWGNAGAATLLLVHGLRDHARSWDWVARALRDQWHVICPDLRGHGDSSWSPDGAYSTLLYISDLAQLIYQSTEGPITIVAHSLGGVVALRYAAIFPQRLQRLAVVEGLGSTPTNTVHDFRVPDVQRWRKWISDSRDAGARKVHRYATLDEAYERMRIENKRLTAEQARHLTICGTSRNEDGSYSWKFDNYIRAPLPNAISPDRIHAIWSQIDCPIWLVHGADSWASHPGEDGNLAHFKNVHVTSYPNAGHWVHHDRFDAFIADLKSFI